VVRRHSTGCAERCQVRISLGRIRERGAGDCQERMRHDRALTVTIAEASFEGSALLVAVTVISSEAFVSGR